MISRRQAQSREGGTDTARLRLCCFHFSEDFLRGCHIAEERICSCRVPPVHEDSSGQISRPFSNSADGVRETSSVPCRTIPGLHEHHQVWIELQCHVRLSLRLS